MCQKCTDFQYMNDVYVYMLLEIFEVQSLILLLALLFAAFYKHILYTMVGYGCGTLVSYQIDEFRRKKWLHIEDYINAHPEHFPELFARKCIWQ